MTGIATAAAVLVPTVAHAAAPHMAVTVNGGAGSSVLDFGSRIFDSADTAITMTESGNGLRMDVDTGQARWSVEVSPPAGEEFYANRRYWAGLDAGDASVRVEGEGRGCAPAADGGWILFRELIRDPETRKVVHFAASYAAMCEGAAQPNTGQLRYNSTYGYPASVVDPTTVAFGRAEMNPSGPQRTVAVRATGTAVSAFQAASVSGAAADDFSIVTDGCQGKTLHPGETCAITVTAHPRAPGAREAALWIPTVDTGVSVRLTADGFVGATGTYYQLSPARLMDTRNGTGVRKGYVGQRGVVSLPVTGRGGVPSSGISAVVLNVTVTGPTYASYLTVYPSGQARPTASHLNYPAGWTGANLVTVPVGAGGKVDFYHHSGSTHVIADVVGFYAGDNSVLASRGLGGQLVRTRPERLFDSRSQGTEGKLDPGGVYRIAVDYGGNANARIRALAVNITAVGADGYGYLTAWDGQGDPPDASTLNFSRGVTVPNMAIVPTSPCGYPNCGNLPAISVYNGAGAATHVIIDVVGFFDDSSLANGLRFKPLKPTRIVDSRSGLGIPAAVGNNATATATTPSTVAGPDTAGLAMNVTAVSPTEGTYLTVWPAGEPGVGQPGISNVNALRGQTVPNAVITGIGPADAFHVYNSRGSTHVLVDVAGTYEWPWGATSATGAGVRAAMPDAPRLSTDLPPAITSVR
ncbi:choice-of-anchor D domain-containing protein [Actinomycetes bacterium KLBMP 9797]